MDTKELRRAYATLGLDDRASLAEAKVAYLTWVALISAAPAPKDDADEDDVDQSIDLLHHELDLAWHAIEQAHAAGILFPRQSRGCQCCGSMPAVRITTHFVGPGRSRDRLYTESAVLCRDCGVAEARAARRVTLRLGWRGVIAPISSLRALTRNSTEVAFARRLRSSAAADTVEDAPRTAGLIGHRLVGLAAGFAAIALAVGVALPTGSSAGEQPAAPSTVQANVLGGTTEG